MNMLAYRKLDCNAKLELVANDLGLHQIEKQHKIRFNGITRRIMTYL